MAASLLEFVVSNGTVKFIWMEFGKFILMDHPQFKHRQLVIGFTGGSPHSLGGCKSGQGFLRENLQSQLPLGLELPESRGAAHLLNVTWRRGCQARCQVERGRGLSRVQGDCAETVLQSGALFFGSL